MAHRGDVDPSLWEKFHRAANMSSQKRRVGLDDEDQHTMRTVVDRVHPQRGAEMEPKAGQENWRHRLMTIGHDPLKEPR